MLRTEIFKIYSDKNMEFLNDKEEEVRLKLLLDPKNLKKLKELGEILYYKRDVEGAISVYEKMIELENNEHEFLGFLGYLYYEAENLNRAIKCLEKSLELDPGDPFKYFLLGNANSRLGFIKEAVFNYDFAIFLDFDMYSAHLDFAKKYEEMNRIEKSLREYKAAYEIDPRDLKIKEKIESLTK
ncbi:MAG: tetratricopeptide repeat protein [Fusobacteriaceae bacterium]